MNKIAIIIGAGPAGLTAAYELLQKTDIKPIIYEMTDCIGGISRTVNYKGNRIDIGGHRFFSKSEKVMQWWQNILPLQGALAKDDKLLERKVPLSLKIDAPDPEKVDEAMLIRQRLSRIFFLQKFFDYPISLKRETLVNLGPHRIAKIIFSYIKSRFKPIKSEKSLEDFFVNRFGRELYQTFFKSYTEKVWGIACDKIPADWGRQRVKGLSIIKTLLHALQSVVKKESSISQKHTETSLIGQFMYPKFGPGQLWGKVAEIIEKKGGEIFLRHRAVGLHCIDGKIIGVNVEDDINAKIMTRKGDYFFSTMPIPDLIKALAQNAPSVVQKVARGLIFRDFITVGLLVKKLKIQNNTKIKTINNIIPDNWIYIQEPNVKIGRLQIFNNWSPYLVEDENTIWLGSEYFCNAGDELWEQSDAGLITLATKELIQIGIINENSVIDGLVIKTPKAYPAYFGAYNQFSIIRDFTDRFENLFLIGRNGMHRYNNMDHSMLTAIVAVENIMKGVVAKENIWAVNTEEEYHESR